MLKLQNTLLTIPHVGPKIAEILADLDIKNTDDLAYYFPRAWEDLSQITPVAELMPADNRFTIKAELASVSTFRSPVKRMYLTQGKAADSSGQISLIWFNFINISMSKNLNTIFYLFIP